MALRNGVLQRCFRDMFAATQHRIVSGFMLRECGRELAKVTLCDCLGSRRDSKTNAGGVKRLVELGVSGFAFDGRQRGGPGVENRRQDASCEAHQ